MLVFRLRTGIEGWLLQLCSTEGDRGVEALSFLHEFVTTISTGLDCEAEELVFDIVVHPRNGEKGEPRFRLMGLF